MAVQETWRQFQVVAVHEFSATPILAFSVLTSHANKISRPKKNGYIILRPNLLYNGYRELFPGGKAAGA
jgi:hypothetical protein